MTESKTTTEPTILTGGLIAINPLRGYHPERFQCAWCGGRSMQTTCLEVFDPTDSVESWHQVCGSECAVNLATGFFWLKEIASIGDRWEIRANDGNAVAAEYQGELMEAWYRIFRAGWGSPGGACHPLHLEGLVNLVAKQPILGWLNVKVRGWK